MGDAPPDEASPPTAFSPSDPEAGLKRPLKRSPSRVSLPPSAPQSSVNTSRTGLAEHQPPDTQDDAEDFPWGPSHPCFPHPNSHVPLSSPLAETTRIIRIQRDWMIAGDLAPTFANLYPEVLDPFMTEDAFRDLIKHINAEVVAAFSPFTSRAWVDAILGVATFWLWEDAGLSGVKSRLRDLERWLDHWNRNIGAKEGVQIIPLRRTGYMSLDIQIPDPHIGPDLLSPSRQDLNAPVSPSAGGTQLHGDFGPFPAPLQSLEALRNAGQGQLPAAVG